MEGPSIWRLMRNGPEVFGEISSFLRALLKKQASCKNMATDKEIKNVCSSIGQAYSLLDSCFLYIYRIKDRKASKYEKIELKDRLQTLKVQW